MLKFRSEMPRVEERKMQCEQLLKEYQDKIPIVLEPNESSKNGYIISQNKFLVPKLYTFHELVFLIRKKLKLNQSESLFITVGDSSFPSMNKSLNSIYNEYKSPDGFLYVYYSSEAIWGTTC